MPHLVIYYTSNLETKTDMTALCRKMADAMLAVRDESGAQVYPTGGTRVLAYPAAHFAIADGGAASKAAGGSGDYAFVYMNLRMGRGRTDATKSIAGRAISAAAKAHFEQLLQTEHIGVTVQIDEGHEAFDEKHSSIHPLFKKV
ncbi:5-carboxymethyl-2-hydroxymuconate Delta-isomerase [Variovorax sp. PCZ-1]|uniref:5-carboxymethyl-2-hydroxymuconate Delta-isomerase n=1 Tax=Variovorax sp. PCZ-1 TaxID=2835533 RepID=UPI001BD01499|nr:5-carboxymethyl-2-hydroxymuconate Delta-isomerase [Variovorax sp. PCZ-1]MBS7808832.1 5-carboxymethyl-2-hydroxymuconate isomerase [Variovorax sp. PCZ-1]